MNYHSKLKYAIALICFSFLNLCCNAQSTGMASGTDGTSIFYKTFGSGKPLLIINGGPGMNSGGFEGLAIKLSKTNHTIIYDQRGTGKSSLQKQDTSTITMKLMIDDIESLRKELKIEKWSVLGHSFGGILASYYASQYPGSIDKIILSSSGGIDLDLLNYVSAAINSRLSAEEQDSVKYWNEKISNGDTSHYAKLKRGMFLASAYVFNKKYVPVIGERLTQSNQLINQLVWTNLQKIHYDCSDKLSSFNNPVLIIQGRQDILKPETAEKSHKAFKNSRVVFIEHCVHYGWLDNEEEYFKEVNSFLAE